MTPRLIYCYDAYCGWCYGFSTVMNKIADDYKDILEIEILSGGMILPEKPISIRAIAGHIQNAYKVVEETTGIKFGEDFLWHIFNPEESDWFPNSEKPAIALSIVKSTYPEKALNFAADLQYALNFEGRDLTDDEAYRHLLDKYGFTPEEFYEKLHDDNYKEDAYRDFENCRKLQVTGYPCVFVQLEETKLHMVARGYTSYEDLKTRINLVLQDANLS